MFSSVITPLRVHARTTCESFIFSNITKRYLFQGFSHSCSNESATGIRRFSSLRPVLLNKSWSHWKNIFQQSSSKRHFMEIRPKAPEVLFPPDPKPVRPNPLLIKTNVKNNVILYRFEKPFMYKCALGFGVFAFVGCLAMADNVYMILCKDLFAPDKAIIDSLIQHLWPLCAIAVGLIAGPAILYTVWWVTIRTVKYIILRKGGEEITMITYHPIKGEVKVDVPLEDINCLAMRDEKKGYVSVQVKDHKFKYMVDKAGHFVNPELFDATVGVRRRS